MLSHFYVFANLDYYIQANLGMDQRIIKLTWVLAQMLKQILPHFVKKLMDWMVVELFTLVTCGQEIIMMKKVELECSIIPSTHPKIILLKLQW